MVPCEVGILKFLQTSDAFDAFDSFVEAELRGKAEISLAKVQGALNKCFKKQCLPGVEGGLCFFW